MAYSDAAGRPAHGATQSHSSIVRIMTHMSKGFHIVPVAVALALGGCDRSSPRVSTADSLLSRDLTLAAATPRITAAPLLGDTASRTDSAVALPKRSAPPIAPPRTGPPTATATAQTTPPAAAVSPTALSGLPIATPVPYDVNYDGATGKAVAAGTGSLGDSGSGGKELPFGTVILGRTNGQICARANRPGDRLVITTTTDTFGPDGARLPAGSQIVVEMTAPEAGSEFAFRAKSVQVDSALLPIYGTVRVDSPTPTGRTVEREGTTRKSTLGTALKGAILGGLLGGSKGAIIGAAGAVAVGAVVDRRNSVTERCLPSGVPLSVVLSAPLVLGQGAK